MKKTLMLVSTQERAELIRKRESAKFLDDFGKRSRRLQAQRDALIASPPPPGFPYRCKECGHGTHADDRLCAPCAIL